MSADRKRRRELERLLAGAGKEIVAIARGSSSDAVLLLAASDPQAALRVDVESRFEEVKRVVDRTLFAIRCRYGVRAAERVRPGFDVMVATLRRALDAKLGESHG